MRGGGALLLLLPLALAACHETVDSLGYEGPGGVTLHPFAAPATYPNAFRELLGKSDADVTGKIMSTFNSLFHGDTSMYGIYFPIGSDQAKIQDVFHDDIRTEGIGLGMLICVELSKRDEFDRLWRYAKAMLRIPMGPSEGYYWSRCDVANGNAPSGNTFPCRDPYGMEEFVTALMFAQDRWGASITDIAYGQEALELLDDMRHKEDQNNGIVQGVTNVFDPSLYLSYDLPDVNSTTETRPAVVKPGYYDLWAQAVADGFWTHAAERGRAYLERAANSTTGLWPTRASFDGAPVAGSNTFEPSGYRAQINMAIDWIWSGADRSALQWETEEADRLLGFFSMQGKDTYPGAYTLDGMPIYQARDMGLVAVNGMTAIMSSVPDRASYVSAVWDLPLPSGPPRYFVGLLQLLALMILGGTLHVI